MKQLLWPGVAGPLLVTCWPKYCILSDRDPLCTRSVVVVINVKLDFPGFNVHPLAVVRAREDLRAIGAEAHRSKFDTAVMCRLLDVSRRGFYAWLRKSLSDRALEDQRLLGLIRAAYTASHGVYGAPRIFLDLREAGETCSKNRVARIMRANNMKALHGYRAPRYVRGHTSLLTPNTLQRGFTVQRPNTAWVTDMTYVRTWEGWLYLAVVIDL
jgi:hypothetical protein